MTGSSAGAASEELDERSLVERLRAGDDAAYEQLVRSQAGRMLAVARRLLRHEGDAEDAVQEAFLQAFRSIDRFKGDARLSTWLHRIVVNAALMRMRKLGRTKEVAIEDLLPRYKEDGHRLDPTAPWTSESGPAAAELGELRQLVRSSIDRLPDSYRNVLVLRDIEQLNTEETARMLGLTVNATKTRLHRARQALRTLLDPHMREGAE